MKKLLLIDCSALFFRSRSALLRTGLELTTSTGIPTTGTYGFLNALFSILAKDNYSCVVPCAEGGNNWRKKESETYKANRESAGKVHYQDMELLLEEVLPKLGMTVASAPGHEADDMIAHIARNSSAFSEVHILTCDKDLLQLVSKRVKVILFNSAKKIEIVDELGVEKHFGVFPQEVPLFKSLVGDPSDNIEGVPSVGPKTAQKLIAQSRESVLSGISETQADAIVLNPKIANHSSKFLANLRIITLPQKIEGAVWYASATPNREDVKTLFEALEFKSYIKRLEKILPLLNFCPNDETNPDT